MSKIRCYVVVSRGKAEPHSQLALVPTVSLTPHRAKELFSPTIFGSYKDKKTARDIAKVVGGRVCELREIDV
jgi:hypothetical protein